MAGKDVFPKSPDSRGHSTFRLAVNRSMEMGIQNELDFMAKKSAAAVIATKEEAKKLPMTEEEAITRKLKPQFKPEKALEKRKTHPIFHDDLVPKSPRIQSSKTTGEQQYNPLDKEHLKTKMKEIDKTNKYPYRKEISMTTEELKKPRVTSMGVIPTRESDKVPELRVIMKAQRAKKDDLDPVLGPIERANTVMEQDENKNQDVELEDPPIMEKNFKAAIVGKTGTIAPVQFAQRPAPPSKPKQRNRFKDLRLRSAQSEGASSGSGSIHIPDSQMLSEYDGALDELDYETQYARRPSQASSAYTVKSTKELLEEAKMIASPGLDKSGKKRKVHTKRPKQQDEKSVKSKASVETATKTSESVGSKKVERSVDEIIASLQDGSMDGVETEADKKIKEIMAKVMARTQAVLGDVEDEIETKPITPTIEEEDGPAKEEEQVVPEIIVDEGQNEPELKQEESEEIENQIMKEALDRLAELKEAESAEIGDVSSYNATDTTQVPSVKSDGEAQVQEEFEKEDEMDLEPIDLEKAWNDFNAPSEVNYEDIVSINAKQTTIHPKQPDQPKRSSSFLSSWEPAEKGSLAPPVKRSKGVHHFCADTEDVQLPDHARGTWRRYHVPSKYDFLQSIPQANQPGSHNVHPTRVSSEASVHETLERRQSAAAKRILQEANNMDSQLDLDLWKERAQKVFDEPEIEISGKSMELKSDDSFLHWTPAPPKWDVQPAKVKEVLFPNYHGAALGPEGEAVLLEESDDSEIEPELIPEEDREYKEYRERLVIRKFGSAMDLTDLQKEKLKAEEEVVSPMDPTDLQKQNLESEEEVLLDIELHVDQCKSSSSALTDTNSLGDRTEYRSTQPESSRAETKSGSRMESARSEIDSAKNVAKRDPRIAALMEKPARIPSKVHTIGGRSFIGKPSLPILPPIQRCGSAPGILVDEEEDDALLIAQDYSSAMEEVKEQKKQLKLIKAGKLNPPGQSYTDEIEDRDEPMEDQDVMDEDMDSLYEAEMPEESAPSPKKSYFSTNKQETLTLAEEALQAGRKYVVYPMDNKKKRSNVDMFRIEQIEQFLAKKPNKLVRSMSLPRVTMFVERELRVPPRVREGRKNSVSIDLDFEAYKKSRNYRPSDAESEREWVRQIWDVWFDQVFPPTPVDSEWSDDEQLNPEESQGVDEDELDENVKPKRKNSQASTVYGDDIEVFPVTSGPDDVEGIELLEAEVRKLTEEINKTHSPSPYDLCRRGAILRKLGQIRQAKSDLDRAISKEPMLLDAYWHRHFIHILQNKKNEAIDDLNFIMRRNKTHAGVYRSLAEINMSKDVKQAGIMIDAAIRNNPNDDEAHFQQAQIYEMEGKMELAMQSYQKAADLNPTKTIAVLKRAMFFFQENQWQTAISEFDKLIKQEPLNGTARMYRGRCYSMLKQWNLALEDLSAAIHLEPNLAVTYYYRGCLLRKLHPKKALQDFSVSLLLDDSDENMMAYLHRGILYDAIGKHEDAIPDFEACLKLDPQLATAHVNLGLIYMTKMDNHHRAIKKFTSAVKADPTYVKAYVCRAEAYSRVHDIKNALLDITRTIHLRPDVHHYYMYRGKLILQMGNLDLAAFCVRHAAELGTGIATSPTQEAIVQSFLKNYPKAIEALERAVRSQPISALYMLLGKTQMKAQRWADAVSSFQNALERVEQNAKSSMKPWEDKIPWPDEAAEMSYLIGLCQMELRDYYEANEAFNNAIKINSSYAEAYYQRGLARLRLNQIKGIQDFNRALAIQPTLFQAFLSRAASYGLKGNYTKAILNCNEAIKLQPKSIRAYLYRGALKYHIKAFSLAIRDLTQAIAIDNTCVLAYFNRAVCYQDSGNWQKALQDYGIVLLVGDELALKVYINRGLLYYNHGDYWNALQDFLLAAKVYPTDKRIHHTLGLCYHKLELLEEAVKSFTRAIELDKFFLDGLICRGNVFMDFGHEIGIMYARRDYERALHINPECLPARVNLAYTLQVSGKYQQAWHQFTAAIDIDPTYKQALEGRAIINLQMSDTFAAYQDIVASVNVKPTAELLTNRGVIHQFMGDKKNAMKDYQEAIKLDEKYSLAYFNAANMYFHNRQFNQALKYYNSALIYNSRDESALLNRAIVKVLLKDAKGALEDFDRAIKLSPHSAHIYYNRGNLYTSLEKFEKADKDYTKALSIQPDDPHVLKRRADVRGKVGKTRVAIEDYKRAIDIQSKRRL